MFDIFYKDENYDVTIHKILYIIRKLHISVLEDTSETCSGIYSTRLTVEGLGFGCNGKGFSRDQSRASAYAEFIERLQNQALFKFSYPIDYESLRQMPYIYAQDEIAFYDIASNETEKFLEGEEKGELGTVYVLPYERIDESKVYIPAKHCEHAYGSNGMCAGNTKKEALVHGICEIFERYVNKRAIFEENFTAPIIPLKYYYANKNIMDFIDNNSNYDVEVRDFSFNHNLPVVGLIIYKRKSSKYFVKFGSHPILHVAIERCVTELLQGRNLVDSNKWFREFSFSNHGMNNNENFIKIFRNGDGDYPYGMFSCNYTYEYNNIWYNDEIKKSGNEEYYQYLLKIIKYNNWELLVRDVSFLGFPSYHVIIPGLSEITTINTKYIKKMKHLSILRKQLRVISTCDKDGLKDIVSYIRIYYNEERYSLADILCLPLSGDSIFSKTPALLLGFYIYLHLGWMDEAREYIKRLRDYSQNHTLDGNIFYSCLDEVFTSIYLKTLECDTVNFILQKFYEEDLIEFAVKTIALPEKYLKIFPVLTCFHCIDCNIRTQCKYTSYLNFHKDVLEGMMRYENE